MDDNNDLYWKKADRPCVGGCERAATVGYDTCTWCRVAPLVARHFPGVDITKRDEELVARIGRELGEAETFIGVARNALLAATPGVPTVDHRDGDAVRRTFGLPARGEGA